MKQLDLHAV